MQSVVLLLPGIKVGMLVVLHLLTVFLVMVLVLSMEARIQCMLEAAAHIQKLAEGMFCMLGCTGSLLFSC